MQRGKETTHDFILCLLALRQKIIFLSKENGSAFRYDQELVQSMFLHSVLTGLSSKAIKNDLRPLLGDLSISDEVLLEKVNIAAHNEMERQTNTKGQRSTQWQAPHTRPPCETLRQFDY